LLALDVKLHAVFTDEEKTFFAVMELVVIFEANVALTLSLKFSKFERMLIVARFQ